MFPAIIMPQKRLTLTVRDPCQLPRESQWTESEGRGERAASDGAVPPWAVLVIAAFHHMLFKGTDRPGPISKEFLNPDFKIVITSPDRQCSVQETQIYRCS